MMRDGILVVLQMRGVLPLGEEVYSQALPRTMVVLPVVVSILVVSHGGCIIMEE